MMGVFQTASETFFSVCSTLALTVTTVTEWTAYVVHANYVLVTNLYTSLCYVVTLILTALDWFLQAVFTILLYVFDFLSEIYSCVCALLVLLWHVCVLVYKVLCLCFIGIETLALGLWNGGVLTYNTLQKSAMDVVETCESTTDYIAMLVQDFVVYVCHFFTSVGSFSTWVVRGLWVGIGYVPATISYVPSHLSEWLTNLWMRSTMWVSYAFMGVTRETYVGICICCVLYLILSRLVYILHSRGLTLFPLWRRRSRNTRHNDVRVIAMAFDRGFESDLDDDDDDMDNNTEEGSNSENSDGGEDTDDHSELTLSDGDSDDDHSVGSESDVSLNSQTFTSEESDHEIDVQLPTASGDHHHSRSSTPSRHLCKDLAPGDFERELERERDKRKCVVCQDANKSVLILPCKHMCLCVACANQIVRSTFIGRRICPLCRTRIERVMDVYV